MTPMVDMELSDDAKGDYGSIVAPAGISGPNYPYGLRVTLTQDELAKLGVDPADAVVGSYFTLHGICCVTSTSASEDQSGQRIRIEAQIEKMAVDTLDDGGSAGQGSGDPVAARRGRLYTTSKTA